MATDRGTVDYLLEQAAAAGALSVRKMFGEYALYCDGRVVALVCDDQLFLKPTAAGRAVLGKVTEGFPYPGARPWFVVTGDRWDDSDWLADLIRRTAAELPLPKPKRPRAKKRKAAS
jgi:TfoX/Sxy family transcriptional regulator of competence genes